MPEKVPFSETSFFEIRLLINDARGDEGSARSCCDADATLPGFDYDEICVDPFTVRYDGLTLSVYRTYFTSAVVNCDKTQQSAPYQMRVDEQRC